jgi:hypothetical protein
MQPEEVLEEALNDLPPGAFLTGAVVIVTFVVPGDEDEDERGPFLAWRCDGVAGRWAHLGMIETAACGMRRDLSTED